MRLAAAFLLLRGSHALTATGPQPVVWSLAGSDSSAGAGVEADLRAFRCLGARGCAVVTALPAQSPPGVAAGRAPPVFLQATHEKALQHATYEALRAHAIDGEEADRVLEELNALRAKLEKSL